MEDFEFKSQICTTREQSERLLALGLKKETADMVWVNDSYNTSLKESLWRPVVLVDCEAIYVENHRIPAWSLHRLLCLIPKEVNIDGFKFPLRSDVIMRLEDADFMYERLMGIIERVIREGYFNQDYLEEKQ